MPGEEPIPAGSPNLCPVGQGFRGAWANRHRMAQKGVP